jgi:hypothetical protein
MNEQIDSGLLDARHLVNRFESSDGVVTKANVARRYGDEDCLQNLRRDASTCGTLFRVLIFQENIPFSGFS